MTDTLYYVKKQIEELEKAWADLQLYGTHEGDCTFSGTCDKCNNKLGSCTKHAEAFNKRTENFNIILNKLKSML